MSAPEPIRPTRFPRIPRRTAPDEVHEAARQAWLDTFREAAGVGLAVAVDVPPMTPAVDAAYAAGAAAGRTAAAADLRQRIQRVWPDPMGQWSAEQADAGRAVKEAMLRATDTQESA